jgi:hypothetical protein
VLPIPPPSNPILPAFVSVKFYGFLVFPLFTLAGDDLWTQFTPSIILNPSAVSGWCNSRWIKCKIEMFSF